MRDAHRGRRAFLKRIFAGAGAIAIAGPGVLDELDRFEPRKRSYVDMGRSPTPEAIWAKAGQWTSWIPNPGFIQNMDKILLAYAAFSGLEIPGSAKSQIDSVRAAIDQVDLAAATVIAATGER